MFIRHPYTNVVPSLSSVGDYSNEWWFGGLVIRYEFRHFALPECSLHISFAHVIFNNFMTHDTSTQENYVPPIDMIIHH
jgi:hypothetical protein